MTREPVPTRAALAPPGVAWPLAGLGALVLLLPLAALAWAVGLVNLGAAATSEAVLTALRVTAVTSTIATVVCVALGVPLALCSSSLSPATDRWLCRSVRTRSARTLASPRSDFAPETE